MDDLNMEVRRFFDGYEKANAEFDVERIAAFYADNFMFAGPNGAQPVQKEGFVKLLPKRKEYFRSKGLVSSRIQSLETSALDSKYVLVKTAWKMHFEPRAGGPLETHALSTYVLSAAGESFHIVFQVDHQDLTKEVQRLGKDDHRC